MNAPQGWQDLSQRIATGMPVYPGDPEVVVAAHRSHARDGYQLSTLQLTSHSGTHVDAPLHTIPNGRRLDAYPLDRFHGPALVLDARGAQPNQAIDAGVVLGARDRLDGVKMALICTGWDRWWGTPDYLRYPYVSPDLTQALVSAGFGLVGFDTLSPDPLDSVDLPAHALLLGNDVLIVENLRGLDTLVGQVVEALVAPLPIAGGDGAPVRAMARLLARR